jgi:hypothetical protein
MKGINNPWCAQKRPAKDEIRNWTFNIKQEAKHAIFLPSSDGVCVKKALEKLVIGNQTLLKFVERNGPNFDKMIKVKNSLVRQKCINKDLVKCIYGELSSVVLTDEEPPVDLLNADLCGNINGDLFSWLFGHLRPRLAENAFLSFTFYCIPRGFADYSNLKSWMESSYPKTYSRNLRMAKNELIATYKTMFQMMFPDAKIGLPKIYQDTSKMMAWKFRAGKLGVGSNNTTLEEECHDGRS